MKFWHLINCKSREEQRACNNLQNQGIECFFPTFVISKIRANKRIEQQEALFPGYLFALIDSETANYNALRSTRGVLAFVKTGHQLVKVPSCVIERLQKQENAAVSELPKSGDKVAITHGTFAGMDAIYQVNDGLERGVLLIKLLNSESCITLDNSEFDVIR